MTPTYDIRHASHPASKLRDGVKPTITYVECPYLPMPLEAWQGIFGDIVQFYHADGNENVWGYFMEGQLYVAEKADDELIRKIMNAIIYEATKDLEQEWPTSNN